MKLSRLFANIAYEKMTGDGDVEVRGLCTNTQNIKEGDLFICYCGMNCDSHNLIADIEKSGAVAVVCERDVVCSLPKVIVKGGRASVATIAAEFYSHPEKKLKLVGVTGTNGKTTTTYMLKSIFDQKGYKSAIIGTLGVLYGDIFVSPQLTTPDPVFMYSLFADMVRRGVEYVFMEVSAHAIYFDKIAGLKFEAGIFTNCTQDHLDFFGDMKRYAACKASFFESGRCKIAVVNADDRLGLKLLKECDNAISYGLENPSDCFAVNISESLEGTTFVINLSDELYEIGLNLAGRHNVYNALAAATCAHIFGVDIATIAEGLGKLKSVPGRLERVASHNGGEVFVDFAHTPDGLEKSLAALRKLCKGKLYCLFGCGGNRDASKRPIMGKIAAKLADFVIITSDNPRYEDPYDIISQIEKGVDEVGGKYVSVTDREVAIEYALNIISQGDVLLIAGKGGETYQEIMGVRHSYSDNLVIKKLIG